LLLTAISLKKDNFPYNQSTMSIAFFRACIQPSGENVVMKNATNSTEEEDEEPLECNYDTDLITLYQALEEQAWLPALDLIEADSQESRDQVRTWVTRYEKSGSVRWSQLPIHAAMIFKAPFKIVKALVDVYPKGVRCTDDQHMLPLHLAFRYGLADNTLLLLLEAFPEAMNAKNRKGRVPALCACPESPQRSKIVRYHIDNAKSILLEDRPMAKQVTELEGKLEEQTKETEELEEEKKAWAAKEAGLKQEIAKLEEALAKKAEQVKEVVKEETREESAPVAPTAVAATAVATTAVAATAAVVSQDVPLTDATDNASIKSSATNTSVKSTSEKTSVTSKSTSGATEKSSTSKATTKSVTTSKSTKSAATGKSAATTKSTNSGKSGKSGKSMKSLGSKIFHLGRKKSKSKSVVNPSAE
jgi:hypothetical protein